MELQVFTEQMNRTAMVTGKELDDLTLEAYWESIQKYNEAPFIEAMKSIRETSPRFPALAQVREAYVVANHRMQPAVSTAPPARRQMIGHNKTLVRTNFTDMLLRKYPHLADGLEIEDEAAEV